MCLFTIYVYKLRNHLKKLAHFVINSNQHGKNIVKFLPTSVIILEVSAMAIYRSVTSATVIYIYIFKLYKIYSFLFLHV